MIGLNTGGIPTELRALPQWVVWKAEQRNGKITKIPFNARRPGIGASITDSSTWATFDEAVAVAGAFDGVGFVFTENDPYAGVDLDEMNDDSKSIVRALASYTERSVSGRGLHIVVRAAIDTTARRRKGWLEVYDRGRYFVVTGHHLPGTPTTIENRQDALDQVLAQHLPERATADAVTKGLSPVELDDRELIARAQSARNGAAFARLWAGDTAGYQSQSEAELALCSRLAFWTGRDLVRMDTLFRASGLMRAKWDEQRGDSTYGAVTIARAVAGTNDVYTPRRDGSITANDRSVIPPTALEDEPRPLRTVRGDGIAMRSIEWLDKPLLQGSAFHLVAGPKGVGKGTWLARKIADTTQGLLGAKRSVLIVSSEDSAEIDLKPRLVAAGADHTRWHLVVEDLALPRDLYRLEGLARTLGDVGLIVLDPVGNHLGGVDTDREGLVRYAIGGLNKLADDLACMVLGVRHLTKQRIHGALGSVLGSTAWVDVPRAVLAFARDDEDEMLFHVQVVAGNRSGRSCAHGYRIELRDVGLKEPVTYVVELGETLKNVDDLLMAPRGGSKSSNARELILDILETDGEQESDTLDARVAAETGLVAKTIRNLRSELVKAGLVRAIPETDDIFGVVARWKVARTAAPRPGGNRVPE